MNEVLICPWSNSLHTTEWIDRFEQRNADGTPIYAEMILENCFSVLKNGTSFSVSLTVRRFDWQPGFRNDFMTFSKLKKILVCRCQKNNTGSALEQEILAVLDGEGTVPLIHPVLLHAQNSSCRRGFRKDKNSGFVPYGQTFPYMITAIRATIVQDTEGFREYE